ncbi:membrane-spanning 4-domains subfamily A member 4A-like [Pyxicephalus adspersus]|uniref:Membrane-spanning 4-domains subfamily A member 4A-like n=1 Tax=Pyxicephalus adspersus TaxID=30357 RepID=A0AAV2ZQK6_PYXAD|nr:TPA: hypothetical protein GDO54_003789 [Pyxicephalus adspersus]
MSTINPNDENFVTILQAGQHSIQAKTIEGQPVPEHLANVPKPILTFYRGQPQALGATQIFVGVLSLLLGISLTAACTYDCHSLLLVIYSGVMFWSGISYIICGSLSVAASANPTIGKVISSLILNIISSLFGVAAIFLFGFNYIFLGSGDLFCVTYEWNSKCEGYFHLNVLVGGVVTMQLLFVFLMFCISMSTSVFACKTLCRNSFQGESVVIYQTIPVPTDPNTTKDFPSVPESYDATLMPQEGDR